jgi:hypothetical protein
LLLSNNYFVFDITQQAPEYSELYIGRLVDKTPTET